MTPSPLPSLLIYRTFHNNTQYIDTLCTELGIRTNRKSNFFTEMFTPYRPSDYNGLIDEFLAAQSQKKGKSLLSNGSAASSATTVQIPLADIPTTNGVGNGHVNGYVNGNGNGNASGKGKGGTEMRHRVQRVSIEA